MTNHPKEETLLECVGDFVTESFNYEWDEWADGKPEILDVRDRSVQSKPEVIMLYIELNDGHEYQVTIEEINTPEEEA